MSEKPSMKPNRASIESNREEWLAASALSESPNPRPKEKLAWIEREGSCQEALGRLPRADRVHLLDDAAREWDLASRHGIRTMAITDEVYPPALRRISTPPLRLLYKGCLPADELRLAVVGSRKATRYGRASARRLVGPLAAAGFTIVSGLARGIDAAAHLSALETGGKTIAVLGSGLLRLYPSEHTALSEQITESGALISEFSLYEPPRREHFPRRNRILTGLAWGTLVIEAAEKSGTLISARHALEQDREVFAVPGPIDSMNSAGVHALIRDGARLVHGVEDLIEELPPYLQDQVQRQSPKRQSPGSAEPALDLESERLWSTFEAHERELDVDTLVEASGLTIRQVLVGLSRLETGGLILPTRRGYYRKCINR